MSECKRKRSDRLIVLEEKRSKITFQNPLRQEIMEVIVDGCAINQGPKCDYLLIQSSGFEHFVELKGVDIPHAFKQIEATILKLSSNPKGIEKHAYIISTSCPLTTSQIQIQKSKFKKNFNSSLLVKNSPVTSRLN